ncbi:MAG: hypothetical protein OEW81_01445, partial [Gammaproteobacteria bacterium]|nr:hypothetical protein [Gammaproteobacteria bacterium]
MFVQSRLGGLSGADNSSANDRKPAISRRIPLIMPGVSEPEKVMSRAQLFQIRLVATATVLLIVYPLLRFLWFPGGYFDLSGIGRLLLVLAGVNLIVGPVLSTLVYRPGKRGLMFDLAVLAVLEI